MNIKDALSLFDHDAYWLDQYISFLHESSTPGDLFDRHHILPQAIFPDFKSFRVHSWNRIDLCPADHLIAHYYLYRALPTIKEVRAAFILMVGLRYTELIERDFDTEVVKDIAKAYEKARAEGVESSIKGWVRIYMTDTQCSVCPPDQVDAYIALRWKVGVPSRVWVMKGSEEHKVLASEVPVYLQQGFVLGRNEHSEATKAAMSKSAIQHHQELAKEGGNAYSFMPHGDQHHRRILGCPPEVAEKIRKTMTGRTLSPEHAAKIGVANKGKHWQWSEEYRQKRSDYMKGKAIPEGLTMKGRTHSEETRTLMSESHKEFYSRPDNVESMNASRPRGEKHWTYGKERDTDTRTKIAASLTGKVQSEETKRKRAASLALARMPQYTKEEVFIFTLLKTAPNKESRDSILKQVKGKTRNMAKGLCVILDGRKDEVPYRYWRQAENWLSSSSVN
jgi:hypothetical protein